MNRNTFSRSYSTNSHQISILGSVTSMREQTRWFHNKMTTDSDSECSYVANLAYFNVQIQNQNPFLTAQSTQIKSVISVPIKDFIHHYPRALFNDIPMVGAHFYDIPGSGRTFTTYPGRDALLRHTRVGAQFNDIPGSIFQCNESNNNSNCNKK